MALGAMMTGHPLRESGKWRLTLRLRGLEQQLTEHRGSMSVAQIIYDEAVKEAREKHAKLVQEYVDGKREWAPCGMDMEREAIIEAFDWALQRS
jgi:hypothetical protein